MLTIVLTNKNRLFTLTTIFLLLLSGCEKGLNLKSPASDPVAVFDDLWGFMNTHYSMFPIKNVNWQQVYNEYRPQVKKEMSDADLYTLMSSMLYTLKDGHVSLMTNKDTATYIDFYQAHPTNFNYSNVINTYLKNDFKRSGPVIYKVADEIGYMYYPSFTISISESELDVIFNDFKETKGIIVDVRNNTGGQSINADKLISRFISEKKLVKFEVTKKGSGHNEFFDPTPFYASPAGVTYKNKIALLTNRKCFSTCNDFALYMSQLPNVKLIGDQTGGGGGNPNNYILSNGWKLQYSATYTLSPSKENIENGIKPNHKIDITSIDEIQGKDPIIEKAFEALQ